MRRIDFFYFLFLKVIIILRLVHLDKIPGITGGLYKISSYFANLIYTITLFFGIKVSKNVQDDVIVSLTSYGSRAHNVYKTIDTLLSQSVKPLKIILWLSETEFNIDNIPVSLRIRQKKYNHFEVRFCEDLKSHKKYYEAMKMFPNINIVIADDDVFYPKDWLLTLLELHNQHPQSVCCCIAHKILIKDNKISEYERWEHNTKEKGPAMNLCPVGVGGVLYPPSSLSSNVFNKDQIITTCINADDLWLRIMGIISRTNVVHTNRFSYPFLSVAGAEKNALSKSNVLEKKNDDQLQNILKLYGNLVYKNIN